MVRIRIIDESIVTGSYLDRIGARAGECMLDPGHGILADVNDDFLQ